MSNQEICDYIVVKSRKELEEVKSMRSDDYEEKYTIPNMCFLKAIMINADNLDHPGEYINGDRYTIEISSFNLFPKQENLPISKPLSDNDIVVHNAKGKVFSELDSTTPQTRIGRLHQDTIYSFFGKPIVLNDSILNQISNIANQDNMLSYSDSIIQIGNISWRVNLQTETDGTNLPVIQQIVLFSSVQPDDQEMKKVIDYLNGIYGKPYDIEDGVYNIKWSSSDDSLNIFTPGSTLVTLRRVHSEEGGTALFFN